MSPSRQARFAVALLSLALLSFTAGPAQADGTTTTTLWVSITLNPPPGGSLTGTITGSFPVQALPPAVQAKLPITLSLMFGSFDASITLKKDGSIAGTFSPDYLTSAVTISIPIRVPHQ